MIKADINSNIQLETAAIFCLANLDLKQGTSLESVMIDFITRVARNAGRELQNKKKSCPQWDSNAVPYAKVADVLTITQLDLISIEHLKAERDLPECAIIIYLYHMVDVVKCFVVYDILLTLYSQQTS